MLTEEVDLAMYTNWPHLSFSPFSRHPSTTAWAVWSHRCYDLPWQGSERKAPFPPPLPGSNTTCLPLSKHSSLPFHHIQTIPLPARSNQRRKNCLSIDYTPRIPSAPWPINLFPLLLCSLAFLAVKVHGDTHLFSVGGVFGSLQSLGVSSVEINHFCTGFLFCPWTLSPTPIGLLWVLVFLFQTV